MLTVKLFGGFQLELDGKVVSIGKQIQNNAIKIFLLLALNPEKGMPRQKILKEIFDDKEVGANAGSVLKNRLYYLRKQLKKAGIPCDDDSDYIFVQKGIYHWNLEIPMTTDVWRFETLAQEAKAERNRAQQIKREEEALNLVTGELLPPLKTEEWVVEKQAEINRIYDKLFHDVFDYYQNTLKDYDKALALATRAAQLHPYEEYQMCMIDSLFALNRQEDAQKLYEETTSLYYKEMGFGPSDLMKERYKKLTDKMEQVWVSTEQVQEDLKEQEDRHGPYYAPFPSFVNSYRFVSRLLERTGITAYLIVLTVEDMDHRPMVSNNDRSRHITELLENAISSSIRKGDLYTRYNSYTFLMLLVCTNDEGCEIAAGRVKKTFKENNPYRKVRIVFKKFSVSNVREDEYHSLEGDNVVCLCIDQHVQNEISGRIYTRYGEEAIEFGSYITMLEQLNGFFDDIGIPMAEMGMRSFGKKKNPEGLYKVMGFEPVCSTENIMTHRGTLFTLMLRVSRRCNATIQGGYQILESGVKGSFISELELIHAIDEELSRKGKIEQ